MEGKTCCVTGHRDIPPDRIPEVLGALEREVSIAVREGYTRFISGFAEGADLLFAEAAVLWTGSRPEYSLVAALPYRGRLECCDPAFRRLLRRCDEVHVLSERCSRECFLARDRWMVNESGLVIGVWDGRRSGGTAYTLRYAKSLGRQVRIIRI